MSSPGKERRLRRLLHAGSRGVVIPLDHGASNGPIRGIEDPRATVRALHGAGASSVVLQKGTYATVLPDLSTLGAWIHLSASTALNPDPNDKRLVGTVEECLRLGADGVSVHVNVGSNTESQQLADLGAVAERCDAWGAPLLAMMYPRGHDIADPHDPEVVKHVARLGAELGADVVKCPFTGSAESFREVTRGCPRPVLISGGAKMASDADFLETVAAAMAGGAAGVSVGRNVWQHASPAAMTRALAELVFEGADAKRALAVLRKGP
ncbi:MAG: 2-amino-3,7-dideoxy-D-threo-hept-6-ulosonate synthase [Thermoplasmatota archaeon]